MDTEIKFQNIFIGGTGRSGTNILRKILSHHSRVATLPFEHRFIIDPYGVVDFYNTFTSTWSPFNSDLKLKEFINFLENLSNRNGKKINYKDWELSKWLPGFGDEVRKLKGELCKWSYKGIWPGARGENDEYEIWYSERLNKESLRKILSHFLANILNNFTIHSNKSLYVEDNTWNILYANSILELLPNAKFIHVIRDPRDVVSSFVNQRWCPSDLTKSIEMYKDLMTASLISKNELPAQNYYEVKLEELVNDTNQTLFSICNFCNISFEPALLKEDLSQSNSARWLKDFDKEDSEFLCDKLQMYTELFDY